MTINIQSRHSRWQLPIQRSAWAFALGAINGVITTLAAIELNTVSA